MSRHSAASSTRSSVPPSRAQRPAAAITASVSAATTISCAKPGPRVLGVGEPGRVEHVAVAGEQRRELQQHERAEQRHERAQRQRPLRPAERPPDLERRGRNGAHRDEQQRTAEHHEARDHDRAHRRQIEARRERVEDLRERLVRAGEQRDEHQQEHAREHRATGDRTEARAAARAGDGQDRPERQPRPHRAQPGPQLAPAPPVGRGQRGRRDRDEHARDDDPARRAQHRHEREPGGERPPHARPAVAHVGRRAGAQIRGRERPRAA